MLQVIDLNLYKREDNVNKTDFKITIHFFLNISTVFLNETLAETSASSNYQTLKNAIDGSVSTCLKIKGKISITIIILFLSLEYLLTHICILYALRKSVFLTSYLLSWNLSMLVLKS